MDRLRNTYPRSHFQALGIEGIELFGHQRFLGAQQRLPDHSHPHCIEICILTSGRQCFVVGGASYWMHGGQAFLTFPGEVHSTGEQPMERGELFWAIMDLRPVENFLGLGDTLASVVREALSRLRERLFDIDPGMRASLEALARELHAPKPNASRVHESLCRLVNSVIEAEQRCNTRHGECFEIVIRHIEENLHKPLRVAELASRAELSESHFKTTFRRIFGVGPSEYVARARIESAKNRLATSSASVTDIALDLGFSSSQYFCYVFRRMTGSTPRQYRTRRQLDPLRS